MSEMTPFERVLGTAFANLPAPVRELHALRDSALTSGLAEIAAEPGALKWLLCKLAGLPQPGLDVPVTVRFIPEPRGSERWERRFGDRRYASWMEAGSGRDAGCLIEHFGMFDLRFRLQPSDQGLRWTLAGWRWLGMPLPAWSVPQIDCLESGNGNRFCFDIDVAFPFLGPVLRYKGWLERAGP